MAAGGHLFPFRTEKLSPPAPMVLGGQPPGRVGRRRILERPPRAGVRVSRLVGVELHADGLVLRAWTEDDIPDIVRACNDPEILRWIPAIPRPYTDEDALRFVRGEF